MVKHCSAHRSSTLRYKRHSAPLTGAAEKDCAMRCKDNLSGKKERKEGKEDITGHSRVHVHVRVAFNRVSTGLIIENGRIVRWGVWKWKWKVIFSYYYHTRRCMSTYSGYTLHTRQGQGTKQGRAAVRATRHSGVNPSSPQHTPLRPRKRN